MKPLQIIELEKELGFELRETKTYIMGEFAKNCYQLHDNQIIGLNLYGNSISDISFLKEMKYLKFLDLRYNEIQSIDEEVIKDLVNLENLDLGYNKVFNIDSFSILENLIFLDVSFNNITSINVLLNLKKLYSLKIIKNNIEIFPLELAKRLRVLQMYSNPIINIPKHFVSSRASKDKLTRRLNEYLVELDKQEIINERVKLIIVGNGRVGKTSLLKKLQGLEYDPNEEYSHGIEIGKLEKKHLPNVMTKNLNINVWDFGGQDIFYATHQLFLSDEAVYILAWTKEENVKAYREKDKKKLPINEKWQTLEYWLNAIRLYAPQSPILVVQTHADYDREKINEQDFEEFDISNFFNFSALHDFDLAAIQIELTKKINSLPMYGQKLPKTYENVILQIQHHKGLGENWISYQRFVDIICRNAAITEGGEDTLLDYLDKTGLVIHYSQNQKLKDFIYINPEWLTKQVYSLINDDLENTKGQITKSYLEKNLPNYKKLNLLELFKQFDLIFEVEEENETFWIAPQYLSNDLDDDKTLKKQFNRLKLALVFRFSRFMPDNVMINFLSRYGSFADDIYWKNGVYFTKNQADCIVVKKNENDLHILIDKTKEHILLLKEIIMTLSEFGRNAKIEISLNDRDFVSLQELKDDYEKGFQEIKSLQGNPLNIQEFDFLFEVEENKINETYLTDEEKEGIRKTLDVLVERINFYKKEHATAADASIRFTLKKQIEDLETEIEEYRNKLKE